MVPGEKKERKILQLNLDLYRSDDELHKGSSVMITTAAMLSCRPGQGQDLLHGVGQHTVFTPIHCVEMEAAGGSLVL